MRRCAREKTRAHCFDCSWLDRSTRGSYESTSTTIHAHATVRVVPHRARLLKLQPYVRPRAGDAFHPLGHTSSTHATGDRLATRSSSRSAPIDFLFATHGASTSSLCWAVSALESHPDVLARVRAEVAAVWSPDSGEPITAEKIQGMRYTQAVAREVVRYRPPATLVPHIAGESFQLTDWYTVPKGAIVFPSVYESSFQGFPAPHAFDPDRFFSHARREDVAFKRNFLAFGAGAHQCVGQRYALNHLVLFLALFVSVADFRRDTTDGCDDPVYMPTIVPRDGCSVYLNQRCASFPSF